MFVKFSTTQWYQVIRLVVWLISFLKRKKVVQQPPVTWEITPYKFNANWYLQKPPLSQKENKWLQSRP